MRDPGSCVGVTASLSLTLPVHTDENYAVGLLWADLDSNLLDPSSWHKSKEPVFKSCFEHSVYGPGHNSFTKSEDEKRTCWSITHGLYTEIVGDPLWDPNRHTYVKKVRWTEAGFPDFGRPSLA